MASSVPSSSLFILCLMSLYILLIHDHHTQLTQASKIQMDELLETDQTIVDLSPVPNNQSIDCDWACGERCKDSSRPNLCKRACGTCCIRCGCVPPGTYGNYESCPCYFSQTTHDGARKCP
ncbi:gibberellin-regulated protein 11-like [Impatiens glandulifera]|uniref:gibberellin-regulated protein 11-like n=1 Tax=Impatiens glandulifera TaxID=253017 RepID=UPI001FB168DD|nr:gibberellin-regulated protein 11-like [Impatiens glandulifera]